MEQAIKQAINGGYMCDKVPQDALLDNWDTLKTESIYLDPLFWHALGKAEGWEKDDIEIPDNLPDIERQALEYKAEQRGCNIPDGSEVTLSQLWIKNNPFDTKEGKFVKIKGNHQTGYIHILKNKNKLPSQYWAGFWILKNNWKDNWHRFVDHLADGGTPDEFFEKLLTKQN